MTTLVLAAHPDDEVLGCGGTMARMAQEKEDVYLAILGEGITSRHDRRDSRDPALEKLRDCTRRSAQILGVKDVFRYEFPDNRFDTVALLEIVKAIEEVIRKVDATVVYTQHGGDLNVDHSLLFKATLTATRPVPGGRIRAVYAYEVASSSEWAFQKFSPPFHPSLFVDISGTLETKMRAVAEYESEMRPFPHPRSLEGLRASATRWGVAAGVTAAEAFEIVREIR